MAPGLYTGDIKERLFKLETDMNNLSKDYRYYNPKFVAGAIKIVPDGVSA